MALLILNSVAGGSDMPDSRRLSDEEVFERIRLIRKRLAAHHL
jgi:hypothetical protein